MTPGVHAGSISAPPTFHPPPTFRQAGEATLELEVEMVGLWLALAGRAEDGEAHLQAQVGFHAGDRSFGALPFEQVSGPARAAGLDAVDEGWPLQGALALGPEVQVRLVASPVRVGLGWQRAYPEWTGEPPVVPEPEGLAGPSSSSVRALQADEFSLALGVEPPAGTVVPFLDLVGTIHRVDLGLAVDGRAAEHRGEAFSLAGRAGARAFLGEKLYVEAAGEASPSGIRSWGAHLALGVALR